VNTSLTTGILYELTGNVGQVTFTPASGTVQTLNITSARIIFTTLDLNDNNGSAAGSLELHFTNSSDDSLIIEFNGSIGFSAGGKI
jgi:hypothetical protein